MGYQSESHNVAGQNLMNGANNQFVAAPDVFVQANTVNNIGWFQQAGRPQSSVNHSLIVMADMLKEGMFDLSRSDLSDGRNVFEFRLCGSRIENDVPITAYWCPFYQGNRLPGYVDVPRHNPAHQFVFTPAMNGCAFVITQSPNGSDWFRVYHNQHPDSDTITDLITRESGEEVLSSFGFREYGTESNPNAFNFLHFGAQGWRYISQPQKFDPKPSGFAIGFRPGGVVLSRAVFS